jgi:hypothetical protein
LNDVSIEDEYLAEWPREINYGAILLPYGKEEGILVCA